MRQDGYKGKEQGWRASIFQNFSTRFVHILADARQNTCDVLQFVMVKLLLN